MSDPEILTRQLVEIVGQIARVMDAEGCSVFLHDPDTNELWSRILADGSQGAHEIRLKVGEGIAGTVMETGEPANIADVGSDARHRDGFDTASFVARSMLCVALEGPRGDRLGVIQVLNKRGGSFTGADEALLEGLAPQVAIALENARLAADLGAAREADARHDAEPVTSPPARPSGPLSDELKRLLIFTMEQIGKSLGAERATLFLFDDQADELWSAVSSGGAISEIRVKADQGVAGWVMRNAAPVNIPDAYTDPRFNPEVDRESGFHTRNILCCPIYDMRKQQRGVVQVLNKTSGDRFTAQDEQLLQYCGDQAATSIENAQLYESVSALREKERELTRTLERQHRELQDAFHEVELGRASLEHQLRGRRWMRRSIFAVVGLVVAIALFLALPKLNFGTTDASRADAPTSSQDERLTVEAREVSDYMQLPGTVRPARWIEVTSPLAASVVSLSFRYGQRVTKGQKLAVLDVAEEMKQLRDARSAYIEAVQALETLKKWSSGSEVRRARRDVVSAQEGLNEARRALEDSQRLFDRGIIPQSELDSAQASVRDRERGLASANEALASAQEQGSAAHVQIAELKLENAKQTLAEIQSSVDDATVRSPADGIIFSSGDDQPGDKGSAAVTREGTHVERGGHLFSIASMQGITLDVRVPEGQVLKVAQGQSVRISIDALDTELDGKIAFVAGRAVKAYSDEAATFAVTVAVKDVDAATRKVLRLGMSATASIETYSNPKAVVVPFDAVSFAGGKPYVRVESASGIEKRPVSVLLTLRDGVALKDGLAPGEVILVPGDG